MKYLYALVIAVMAFVGCAYPAVPEAPRRTADVTVHGDTRFLPRERLIAETKAHELEALTDGRARVTFLWDYDEENFLRLSSQPHMLRVPRDFTRNGVVGTFKGGEIGIAADVCRDLGACILHELGHLVGMDDVPDANAAMSLVNAAPHFGAADRAECIRVGLCSVSPRNVTTVTVTVDPSVPSIEPNYPAW